MKPNYKKLSKLLDIWFNYHTYINNISGLNIGIIHDGKVIYKNSYGFANAFEAEKMDISKNFRIASISKLFTATAIMILFEQGKINLDDKVSKYLPWFKSKDGELQKRTIRNLIHHSAGLIREGHYDIWQKDQWPDEKKFIEQFKKSVVKNDTHEFMRYSNLAYGVLGRLIEKVSSQKYDKYIQKNILIKLGMKNTYVDYDPNVDQNLCIGHSDEHPEYDRYPFEHVNTGAMEAATGFISNVDDLLKFAEAQFVGSKKLFDDETKKEMQRVSWVSKDDEYKRGLGFEIYNLKDKQVFGHSGGFMGFNLRLLMCDENKLGVVVLTNDEDGLASYFANSVFKIVDFYLQKSDVKKVEKDYSKYEGRYANRWSIFNTVQVGNELYKFWEGNSNPFDETPLKYEKDGVFLMDGKDSYGSYGEKTKFFFDKNGKVKKVDNGVSEMLPFEEFVKNLKK